GGDFRQSAFRLDEGRADRAGGLWLRVLLNNKGKHKENHETDRTPRVIARKARQFNLCDLRVFFVPFVVPLFAAQPANTARPGRNNSCYPITASGGTRACPDIACLAGGGFRALFRPLYLPQVRSSPPQPKR